MRRRESSTGGHTIPRGEELAAIGSAAALYVVGATLIATSVLLPNVSSPAGATAVAVVALVTAAVLIAAVVRRRGGLMLACFADLWGVVLILVLCASTGGAESPFAMIYFFAIGHAAAFQPRGRFVLVCLAGMLAFLAPVAYEQVSSTFGAIACVGIVLALLTVGAIHIAVERMRDQRRRLRFLISATAELASSLDPEQTLRRIAGTALPELAELCVIDLVDDAGSITATVAAALAPDLAARIEELHGSDPPGARPGNPIAEVLARRAPLITEEPAAGEGGGSDPHRRFMRETGLRSIAVIPMVARGRMLGAISFLRPRRFETGEVALLQDLTGRASLAFDNAGLYAERDRVAHTLRRSLMPAALPMVPGLELESYFRPMGAGSEVGGDFYDVFGDRESCWLVVGDVCGKGAEAAVLTGFLRHTTGAYAREGAGPASVLRRVNKAMLEHDFGGRFATAILAHLAFDGAGVRVTIATAGHPAALISRARGGAEQLGEYGTLLGVFPDPSIGDCSTVLRPGDALALYTDGLPEAQAPDRVLTPPEMLEQLAGRSPGSAREAIDALLEMVEADDGARDDIAILAACVEAGAGSGAAA